MAKAREETGAVSAGTSGRTCGVCPVCKSLWNLRADGTLPTHANVAGPACEGSHGPTMPQCKRCGQYEMNHDRHSSPGCPGVYS